MKTTILILVICVLVSASAKSMNKRCREKCNDSYSVGGRQVRRGEDNNYECKCSFPPSTSCCHSESSCHDYCYGRNCDESYYSPMGCLTYKYVDVYPF